MKQPELLCTLLSSKQMLSSRRGAPLERRCMRVRTYEVRIFVPTLYSIEAKDAAEILEKVGELYKELYFNHFRELVKPLPKPEDVT